MHFRVIVVQQRNVQKKLAAELLFGVLKPIAFLTFSLL